MKFSNTILSRLSIRLNFYLAARLIIGIFVCIFTFQKAGKHLDFPVCFVFSG